MQHFLAVVGIIVAMLVGDEIANDGKITRTAITAIDRLIPF